MRLSSTELQLLGQIAGGNRAVGGAASALNRTKVQIRRLGRKLSEKGFILRTRGAYTPEKITHVTLLLQLLSTYPSLINPLSNSGIKLLTALLEERTVPELIKGTKLKRAMVFRKLKEGRQIGLITVKSGKYAINEKIWPAAKEFLFELKKYEETTDARIPTNSTVYFKNEKEIIFSTKEPVDAALTAFSAYLDYGIKIFLPEEIYYLPKRNLSMKEVFLHSLYVAEKSRSARDVTFAILFYAKFKDKLLNIKHSLIDLIKRILAGEKIPRYPDLNEIREKGDVYDIQV